MKSFLLTIISLAAMALPVAAQHYVGGSVGGGSSYVRLYPAPAENYFQWGKLSGGVAWKYYSPKEELGSFEQYISGVSAEVRFLQRGFKYDVRNDAEKTYIHKFNSVVVPIMWQPHFSTQANKFRIYLNAGVTFSYNFGATAEWLQNGESYQSGPYEMKLVRDNRFGYGLVGGLGFNVIFDKWEITAEGRYYFSYSDIWRTTTKYPFNPIRSPVDNIEISVGVFYKIGNDANLPWKTEKRKIKDAQKAAAKAAKNKKTEPEAETLPLPDQSLTDDPVPQEGGETVLPEDAVAQQDVKTVLTEGTIVPRGGSDLVPREVGVMGPSDGTEAITPQATDTDNE